jgi:L-alanine-DL-glutamate epimerase-like enolase superfamily enzyme
MKIKSVEAFWLHIHDLVGEDCPVEDGMIAVPERPGLGITVREDFLRAHTVSSRGTP